jgi:hypothetical protein
LVNIDGGDINPCSVDFPCNINGKEPAQQQSSSAEDPPETTLKDLPAKDAPQPTTPRTPVKKTFESRELRGHNILYNTVNY